MAWPNCRGDSARLSEVSEGRVARPARTRVTGRSRGSSGRQVGPSPGCKGLSCLPPRDAAYLASEDPGQAGCEMAETAWLGYNIA
jgi:hypothetical protein